MYFSIKKCDDMHVILSSDSVSDDDNAQIITDIETEPYLYTKG